MSPLHLAPPSTENFRYPHHPLSSAGLGEGSPSTPSSHIPDSGYGSLEAAKADNGERSNQFEEYSKALLLDEDYLWSMPLFALLPSSMDFTDESPSRLRRNNVFDRVSSPIRLFEQK